MRKTILFTLLVCLFVLSACSGLKNPDAVNLQTARDALTSFYSLLSYGAYEQAAFLYGGSYEALRSLNPSIPADDYISLWENACTVNGYQCLEIKQILNEFQNKEGIFHFLVEFKHRDGSLLMVSPCCGANATQLPPQTQFELRVERHQGKFLVLDLPVFIP
jgi:hypothetical protein